MNTKELFSYIDIVGNKGKWVDTINGLAVDSRKVKQGYVFICIDGYTVDGHNFIQQAIKLGASVIVTEKTIENEEQYYDQVCIIRVKDTNRALANLANAYYEFPSKKMNIIGITGTNGKTTTTHIINDVLRKSGRKTGMMGTMYTDMDGKIIPSKNTTNEALSLQSNLYLMEKAGITDVVMEVSSHGLLLGRLRGVEFDSAAFTNLTQDHLDFHGTMNNYGTAKSLLFSQLGNDVSEQKWAVLNADDNWSKFYEEVTSANVFTFGIHNKEADFIAEDIQYGKNKTMFNLNFRGKRFEVEISLLGEFNIYNVLLAIAVLHVNGLSIDYIVKELREVSSVTGRMEKVENPKGISVFVDYAHTPDGIEKVLTSTKVFTKGKTIIVFGTGGNRDRTKRPIMAEKASKYAEYVVLTTDNPRFESPNSILEDMVPGMVHENYVCIEDRREAIKHAIDMCNDDDVLIIAGKGHETYQIIGDKEYPFSDKEVALEFLK